MGGSMSKITSVTKLAMEIHIKARSSPYQRTTDVKRFPVPDEKVDILQTLQQFVYKLKSVLDMWQTENSHNHK